MKYKILKDTTIDNVDHVVGATVELNEGKAERLVADGSLELA